MNDLFSNITRSRSDFLPAGNTRTTTVKSIDMRQTFAANGNTATEADSAGKSAPASDSLNARVSQAVRQLNEVSQNLRRDLSFNVDKESGKVVIQVYDSETRELIRIIPPEETLAMIPEVDVMADGGMKGFFVKITA